SGKSTLMNIISGLEKADSGEVFVNSENLSSMNEKQLTEFRRNNVGYVFQQYYLLPHLNVENNIRIGANLGKNNDISQVVEAMNLEDKLRAKPSELSGGEQQRVCIARALAKKPKLLFLDEPTGALDEQTGRQVLDYIVREQVKYGFTMVGITHNQNIAEMAHTVIKINSGKIIDEHTNAIPKTAYEIGW
ncbi:MAG: ABC transporter ATP-binding protein, partial [Firmicutes bacterium]|nr:ABC transporter ATP-binding protein [Bacillota bacterium]